MKNYLFDITKTLDLNLEILSSFLSKPNTPEPSSESICNYNTTDISNKELLKAIQKVKNSIEKKHKKLREVTDKKCKILIDNQINEELRRKIEENKDYQFDQIKDLETGVKAKEDYIKMFEKKLMEVEVYIQKKTKELNQGPYVKYQNWKLTHFLDENISLQNQKAELNNDKEQMINEIKKIKKENSDEVQNIQNLKSKKIEFNEITNTITRQEKINSYIEYYQNINKFLSNKINIMKSYFNSFNILQKSGIIPRRVSANNLLKYNSVEFEKDAINIKTDIIDIKKSYNNININNINNLNVKNNDENEGVKDVNYNKKLNGYMDFSVLLNKRFNESHFDDEKSYAINNMGSISVSNVWDISCINKA